MAIKVQPNISIDLRSRGLSSAGKTPEERQADTAETKAKTEKLQQEVAKLKLDNQTAALTLRYAKMYEGLKAMAGAAESISKAQEAAETVRKQGLERKATEEDWSASRRKVAAEAETAEAEATQKKESGKQTAASNAIAMALALGNGTEAASIINGVAKTNYKDVAISQSEDGNLVVVGEDAAAGKPKMLNPQLIPGLGSAYNDAIKTQAEIQSRKATREQDKAVKSAAAQQGAAKALYSAMHERSKALDEALAAVPVVSPTDPQWTEVERQRRDIMIKQAVADGTMAQAASSLLQAMQSGIEVDVPEEDLNDAIARGNAAASTLKTLPKPGQTGLGQPAPADTASPATMPPQPVRQQGLMPSVRPANPPVSVPVQVGALGGGTAQPTNKMTPAENVANSELEQTVTDLAALAQMKRTAKDMDGRPLTPQAAQWIDSKMAELEASRKTLWNAVP